LNLNKHHTTNLLSLFNGHRFTFNGKEADNDVYGMGNLYDYGFRIYNPRLGKFLSVDPLSKSFPFYTPYQFSGNKPICSIDLDGREDIYYLESFINRQGGSVLEVVNETQMGSQALSDFQSQAVNIGYDMFVMSVPLGGLTAEQGAKGNQGVTSIVYNKNSVMLDENRNTVNVFDEITKIRENQANGLENSGTVYNDIKNGMGEEVLFSKGLGESIQKGRSIIVMKVNSAPLDKINSPDKTVGKGNLSLSAKTFGHELISHALRMVTGKKQSPNTDHKDYQGQSDISGVNLQGSPGEKFESQVDEVMKER
jgi:RHS repeat-associated protein